MTGDGSLKAISPGRSFWERSFFSLRRLDRRLNVAAVADGKRAFVTLDGLRGLAAFAVLGRHTFPDFLFESYLAVDFFFVLSGFVLAHAYGQRLRAEMTTLDFMKVRLVRLYPLYALALVLSSVTVLTQFLHGHPPTLHTAIDYAAALLFLPSPASEGLFPLVGPSWSLFFELVANAAFALSWRRFGNRVLVAVVAMAAVILIAAVPTRTLGFVHGAMDSGFYWSTFNAGLARVGYSFFCGVLIYQMWSIRKSPINFPPVVIAAVLFAILAAHPSSNLQAVYDLCATIVVFPLIVWLAASSRVSGRLAHTFMVFGLASYGVYILQVSLMPVRSVIDKLNPGIGNTLPVAIGFVVFVFVFAIVTERYFDRPIRRRVMLWMRKSLPPPLPTVSQTRPSTLSNM